MNIGNFKHYPQTVTMTVNTGAHVANDVLADTQTVTLDSLPINTAAGHRIEIDHVQIIDADDQAQNMDVVFMTASQSLGTETDPVSITDANLITALQQGGIVSVNTWFDMINSQVGQEYNVSIPMYFTGQDIYVGLISRGTGTYAGGTIELRFSYILEN